MPLIAAEERLGISGELAPGLNSRILAPKLLTPPCEPVDAPQLLHNSLKDLGCCGNATIADRDVKNTPSPPAALLTQRFRSSRYLQEGEWYSVRPSTTPLWQFLWPRP